MKRRTYLSYTIAGIATATAGCTDALDSLGLEEAEVSSTVHRQTESFQFEADSGDDIVVTAEVEESGAGTSGNLEMTDPDGASIVETGLSSTIDTIEEHTAQQTGTYQVTIDPNNDRVGIRVTVQSDD